MLKISSPNQLQEDRREEMFRENIRVGTIILLDRKVQNLIYERFD